MHFWTARKKISIMIVMMGCAGGGCYCNSLRPFSNPNPENEKIEKTLAVAV
jgi:K+-transporting ATPase A subunit